MAKTLVAISYIHYPVSIARYFKRALSRREDIDLVSLGPFYGDFIPWMGGMRVPNSYIDKPDIVLPQSAPADYPIQFIEYQFKKQYERLPDVWIQVDAGMHFRGKPTNGKNFTVETDNHVLQDWYSKVKQNYDVVFAMHKAYMNSGEVYLPYAYDQGYYYPLEREKEYDVVCVGMPYQHRIMTFDILNKRGLKTLLTNGPAYHDAQELYAKARVGFNFSTLADTNCRVFELAGMGIPAVTNRTPDLGEFFNDTQMQIFDDDVNRRNPQAAADAVTRLLEDSDRMCLIAKNALEAAKNHTFDKRVEQILNYV